MQTQNVSILPQLAWAQNREVVFITFRICNVVKFQCKINGIRLEIDYESDKQSSQFSLNLIDKVKESRYVIKEKTVLLKLIKNENIWWKYITPDKHIKHLITVDWEKWMDEDEDDEDDQNDFDEDDEDYADDEDDEDNQDDADDEDNQDDEDDEDNQDDEDDEDNQDDEDNEDDADVNENYKADA